MKNLITSALIAFVAFAQAALPTSGLPNSNAPFVAHISFENAAKTSLGKIVLDEATKAQTQEKPAKLIERLGIRITDIRDLTLLGNPTDNAASVVALIRGRFSKSKIEGFAASKNVPFKTVAGFKAWDANRLGAAVADEAAAPSTPGEAAIFIIVADDSTLLAATEDQLTIAAEALKANKPWNHAALSAGLGSVTQGWLAVNVDIQTMEAREAAANPQAASQPSGAKTAVIALGENASDVQLRVAAQFVSEQKATEQITQLKGLIGFAQLGLMPAAEDSPDDKQKKSDLLSLVQRLKIEQAGDKGTFSVDYPAAKLSGILREQIAEAAQEAANFGSER